MRTLVLTAATLLISAAAQASGIIYIGDSQSASNDTLLSNLESSISAHHRIVAGNAACGTRIDDHLNGGPAHCKYPGIQHMNVSGGRVHFDSGGGHVVPVDTLFSSAPQSDTVVVELGDNHYGDRQLAAKARKMVTKILESGRSCVWIGPASIRGPSSKCKSTIAEKRAVSDTLQETLASVTVKGHKCQFINSYELTKAHPPYSEDPLCIHYRVHDVARYGGWADAIRPSLMRALDGPAAGSHNHRSSTTTREAN